MSLAMVMSFLSLGILMFSCGGVGTGSSEKTENTTEDAEKYTEDDFSDLISQGDYENAEFVLKESIAKANKNGNGYHGMNGSSTGEARKIYGMASQLYKARAMDIIKNNGEASELAILLSEYPVFGTKEAGLVEYRYYENAYPIASNSFNTLCDNLLNAALAVNNYELAQTIVNLYMEDVNVTKGDHKLVVDGVEVDGNHSYSKITNTSKEAAQKKLNSSRPK